MPSTVADPAPWPDVPGDPAPHPLRELRGQLRWVFWSLAGLGLTVLIEGVGWAVFGRLVVVYGLALLLYLPLLLVHELGHAVAARLLGQEVGQFAVGPILGLRGPDRTWAWSWRPNLLSGHVVARPVRMDGYRRARAWIVAAGPLATLLAFGVLVPVWRLLSPAASDAERTLLLALPVAGILALSNVVGSAFEPDGDLRTLFHLVRNDRAARRLEAAQGLGLALRRRLLPRDWPDGYVREVREGRWDDPRGPSAAWCAFVWADGSGAGDEAHDALSWMFGHPGRVPRPFWPYLWLAAAEHNVGHRRDPRSARAALARSIPSFRGSPLREYEAARHLAEARVLAAEGRRDEAFEAVRRGHALRRELALPDGPLDEAWRARFLEEVRATPEEAREAFGPGAPQSVAPEADRPRSAAK